MINSIDDVKRDYRYVWEFESPFEGTFKRCNKSCLALSKVMGVDFKAVYRNANTLLTSSNAWTEDSVDWDSETIYAVNPKGKVISFSNSEWGGVGRVK